MELIEQYLQGISWEDIVTTSIRIMLILLVAWGVMLLIRRGLKNLEQRLLAQGRKEGEPPSEAAKRVETLIRLVRQAALIAITITVGLIILREIGLDIAPILAGAGILGLALGFGAQHLVRDVIAGFFFILENQVRVGDVAVVNGTGGLVERVNFRTLVLRDLGGVVHVFQNSGVEKSSQ